MQPIHFIFNYRFIIFSCRLLINCFDCAFHLFIIYFLDLSIFWWFFYADFTFVSSVLYHQFFFYQSKPDIWQCLEKIISIIFPHSLLALLCFQQVSVLKILFAIGIKADFSIFFSLALTVREFLLKCRLEFLLYQKMNAIALRLERIGADSINRQHG